MHLAATVLAIAMLAARPIAGQAAPPAMPPQLAAPLAKYVKLTPDELARLQQDQPVSRLMPSDPAREVSVLGLVWVNAPLARYIAAVKDIEQFETGENFPVTKRISSPPRLEDFDRLTLPPDDLKDLRTCKVGACQLKVSEASLLRMQKEVDWTKPTAPADVDRAIRQLAFEYVTAYLQGGNERLAVYRDAERPTFVAREFAAMVEQMPSLTEYLPALKQYLLEFPNATLPNADSFLYWQETRFGLKPTIRINHLTISEQPGHTDVVSKMLYSDHYFWTAIELRVLVPDAARGGFWYVSINQSRSDGLSGFVGRLIRGKVRGEAEDGMKAALTGLKAKMEQR
jgi:hypothetical protein